MECVRKKYHALCCNWKDISNICACCDVGKYWMCGRSLKNQLSIVSIASIVISSITFIISMAWLIYMSDDDILYNNDPIMAAHLIIYLVVSLMSVYQFTISVMLLRQTTAKEDDVFYYVLWYVSHLGILSLYLAFFFMELTVCLRRRRYGTAAAATAIAGVYQGIFIYFTVVVNAALYAVP